VFGGSYELLSPSDVYCRVFDKDNDLIAYIDCFVVNRNVKSAYPLRVSAKSMTKLADKRLNPVVLFCMRDGVIYGKLKEISGVISWDFKNPDDTTPDELTITYYNPKPFRFIKFT
jgi:hypothetical protein